MQHDTVQAKQTTRRFLFIACALALTGALTAPLAQPVHANGQIVVPPVPANLVVPPGNKVFLMGFASGTQNYICLPLATVSSGFAWTFFGPQTTLFDGDMKQIITHFLSPNPDENGTPRATWQHSRDTSAVWAMTLFSSTDPNFVVPSAIPWLLLQVVGTEPGPTGGNKLSKTTYIQRLNTQDGVAPSTGCATATDVGKKALVPYMTDYFFYKATGRH